MPDTSDRRVNNLLIMEKLDRINENIKDVKVISESNRIALRGHNSDQGLVGKCQSNIVAIADLKAKSNRNDGVVGVATILGTVLGVIFGNK